MIAGIVADRPMVEMLKQAREAQQLKPVDVDRRAGWPDGTCAAMESLTRWCSRKRFDAWAPALGVRMVLLLPTDGELVLRLARRQPDGTSRQNASDPGALPQGWSTSKGALEKTADALGSPRRRAVVGPKG